MTAATGTGQVICGSVGEEGTGTSCVAEKVWGAPSGFGATEAEAVGTPGVNVETGAGASRGAGAGGDTAGGELQSGEDTGALVCAGADEGKVELPTDAAARGFVSCVRNNDEIGSRGARGG